MDAFLKRNFIFSDNKEKLSRNEKKRAYLEEGRLFVDGREAFWQSKKMKFNNEDFSVSDDEVVFK